MLARGPGVSKAIRLLIADDHPVVRDGVAAIINQHRDLKIVAEASNGREAIAAFEKHAPDVALLDLRMPDVDGIEVIQTIRHRSPGARIIVLTTFDSEEDVANAMRAGAKGYLLKDCPRKDLVEAIRTVHSGKTWIAPPVGSKLMEQMSRQHLTPRELEALRLLAAGKSNKEIAAALDIAEGTTKIHLNKLFQKLGVTSRTEALAEAVKRGLIRLH
jgi:two-component system NarL family response regulator